MWRVQQQLEHDSTNPTTRNNGVCVAPACAPCSPSPLQPLQQQQWHQPATPSVGQQTGTTTSHGLA